MSNSNPQTDREQLAKRLAAQLKIPRGEAMRFINRKEAKDE